jgi:protein unc-13
MNLHFRVKLFYNQYVKPVNNSLKETGESSATDYCEWFEPFVMNWLADNDDISMEYLHNAWEKDKQSNFQKTSEHCMFSPSVVDVFTTLNQCFDVIKKLECPLAEVQNRYMLRFSLSIFKILLGYSNIIRREFSSFTKQVTLFSVYRNNSICYSMRGSSLILYLGNYYFVLFVEG